MKKAVSTLVLGLMLLAGGCPDRAGQGYVPTQDLSDPNDLGAPSAGVCPARDGGSR